MSREIRFLVEILLGLLDIFREFSKISVLHESEIKKNAFESDESKILFDSYNSSLD